MRYKTEEELLREAQGDEAVMAGEDPEIANEYIDPNLQYYKQLPKDRTYVAPSLAPDEAFKDPSIKANLPEDTSPVYWKRSGQGVKSENIDRDQLQKIRDFEGQKYGDIANKSDLIKEAIAAKRSNDLIANVGQSLAGMARAGASALGRAQDDSAFWNQMRSQGAEGVRYAEDEKKNAIADYLAKKRLGSEAISEFQGLKKQDFDREKEGFERDKMYSESERIDPTSNISAAYREYFKSAYPQYANAKGIDPNTGDEYNPIDEMSARDVEAAMKQIGGIEASRINQELRASQLGLQKTAIDSMNQNKEADRSLKREFKPIPKEGLTELEKARLDTERSRKSYLDAQTKKAGMPPQAKAADLPEGEDIPNSLRSKALTEKKALDEFNKVKTNVLKSYDAGGRFTVYEGNAPSWMKGGARSEYQAYKAMIASQVINKVPGIRSDSDFRNIVEPMLPSPGDPKDTIATKKKVFEDYINSVAPETTTYDSIYGTTKKSETPPSSVPLVTPDMAGSKMINGVLYKKVPGGWRKAQ